jgi:tRNA threonylcarbamoyladenosine biosynthesis protein TsaB
VKILAVETSTPLCSVALSVDGEVRGYQTLAPRGHASLVLPWIERLLKEAGLRYWDIDRLAVGRGPGGFTSLRIGLGIIQGVALAHDLPIAPVSSLAALARTAADTGQDGDCVLALIDARMGEVFAGCFKNGPAGLKELSPETVCPPEQLSLPVQGHWCVAGSGLSVYPDIVRSTVGGETMVWLPDVFPLAESVIALSDRIEPVAPWELEPNYVRDQVTQG